MNCKHIHLTKASRYRDDVTKVAKIKQTLWPVASNLTSYGQGRSWKVRDPMLFSVNPTMRCFVSMNRGELITPARGPIGINWSDWAKAGPVYGTGALLYASKSYTRLGFIFSKSSYVEREY
jgi:hypothetical protein